MLPFGMPGRRVSRKSLKQGHLLIALA